jgi:hypothetical protein
MKQPEDTSGKVCRYWPLGSCHFGQCKFLHIGNAGSGLNLNNHPNNGHNNSNMISPRNHSNNNTPRNYNNSSQNTPRNNRSSANNTPRNVTPRNNNNNSNTMESVLIIDDHHSIDPSLKVSDLL